MEYEILAPAGNIACANAAIDNGANAIYLGLNAFSARANAENFDETTLKEILDRAHFFGVKVYVAMNTLVKENERKEFYRQLFRIWSLGVDAIIMQDALLGKEIHERYPEILLHLSTQAGVCNEYGAKFAKECGFSRVILARETPFQEIEKITKIIETEVFVQGALCTCFSGQCYFSSFAGGNSGNRGRCKQPCRKLYSYDRVGFEEQAYALSLSDLCVGEEIEKLQRIGVTSFKIEGRMRRAEYVASSVAYYRLLLDGAESSKKEQALIDLKRTYNRGNYTKGLAFSQDKRFLSRAVQGHLGEKVGVVKVENGKYMVESRYSSMAGDAFKILRNGKEVGGAMFVKAYNRGFIISSKTRLLAGDGVFLTTSASTNERLLKVKRRKTISLSLRFMEGESAVVSGGGVTLRSDWKLEEATQRPLSKEELCACFEKTDALPLNVVFSKIELGNVFVAKSILNGFRREFYAELERVFVGKIREELPLEELVLDRLSPCITKKKAVIVNDLSSLKVLDVDIAIYKPESYEKNQTKANFSGDFEKYLYLPAFTTSEDLLAVESIVKEYGFDGVYVESYCGIEFAKERGFSVFAGTGVNLTNRSSLQKLKEFSCVKYYAISKELDEREQRKLLQEGGFVLTMGNLKLMDLCYCPFEKSCAKCDKKSVYTLTDENGRIFPTRRYTGANNACRFETYNCATLIGTTDVGGSLIDCSLMNETETVLAVKASEDENLQKTTYPNYTFGHRRKSVL